MAPYNAYSRSVVSRPGAQRAATLAVVVAALGYFVDIYDLILFGTVRVASLKGIGITSPGAIEDQGIYLLNMQLGGMLVGGILWGVLGDKRGRLSVLFGSITLYSLANLANGLVGDVDSLRSVQAYAVCRLVAGIGLAGELGAGVTLVSELMGARSRGVGTMIIAAVGVLGGLAAGAVGGAFGHVVDWTTAYYIGGVMGLALLALRIGVVESGMFETTLAKPVSRGNFFKLFTDRRRLGRYLAIIGVGVPVWYCIAILFVLAPELGKALGLDPPPKASLALSLFYGGASVGSLASGLISQYLRSRKRALAISITATAAVTLAYYTVGGSAHWLFYTLAFVGGAGTGYWAIFVTTAAELFGTNLRATVTTTVPNFVRGSAVLLTVGYKALKDSLGPIGSGATIGVLSFAVAFAGLATLRETFAVDLDYHEDDTTAGS